MNRSEIRRLQKLTKSGRSAHLAEFQRDHPGSDVQRNLDRAMRHHRAGRLGEAENLLQQVLKRFPKHHVALARLGLISHQRGRSQAGLELLECALAVKRNFVEALHHRGFVLLDLGRFEDAAASYRMAATLDPRNAEAHYSLGVALRKLDRLDDAIESYQQALAVKPNHASAHYNLCIVLEKLNRIETLRAAVEKARHSCPGDPRFCRLEAEILRRDGDLASARAILEGVKAPAADAHFMAARAYLLGDICDRLGDTGSAYRYFEAGNRWTSQTPEARLVDRSRALSRTRVLADFFTEGRVRAWRQPQSRDGRDDPVFLVGFPRSGTTLLDTILLSHPSVAVVEERPAVQCLRQALSLLPDGDPGALANLRPAHLHELRRAYFSELDKHLEPNHGRAVVIDKMPLNIIEVGPIHLCFPRSRFLFALRHPYDSVLSCFKQDFALNDAMANFLSIEDSARFYDEVMGLWQQYQRVLSLDIHTVRYESLIEEFEGTVSPVLEFLGLDWDESVRDFAETGLARGRINTPSYNQVTQPLYTTARGRWERYANQLSPVLPILESWALQFGYESPGMVGEGADRQKLLAPIDPVLQSPKARALGVDE